MLSTLQYRGYTAKITNISKNTDITDYINECNISLPKAKVISPMECKFNLEEKLIDDGNEIKIEIFDEVGNSIYTVQGEANLKRRNLPNTYVEKYEYIIKDNIDDLFQKTITENTVYYDLFLCNNNDVNNSLLHIIAKNLGFNEFIFDDVKYENDKYIRVPFVFYEENGRWIDKLQAFIEATNGIIYIHHNKKLIFKNCNFSINKKLELNNKNIIRNIEEIKKDIKYNAIKVPFDNFKKLENQVVFNLASKVILNENQVDTPTMRITYITSSVANPTITKATAYYFTSEDPTSKVDITLQENVHYKAIVKNTNCEVNFINNFPYKLYIDNFEIKGIPLVKYVDNDVLVSLKTENINPMIYSKNNLVQTDEQAKFMANTSLVENILSEKDYSFYTYFLHDIELGSIYSLDLENIHTQVKINSIDISLKTNVFTMKISASEISLEHIKTTHKTKISANPNTQFIDLKPLEEKIEDNATKVKEVTQKIQSKLHVSETEPITNVEEHDVWLKESTNTFKVWLNGKWNPIAESDILPAIKHYNSLRKAELNIGKVNDRAGLFLINNDEKFGAINGTLAEVSIDKKGAVKIGNVNNLLEWNTKDPSNPNKVKSKLYMGVTDVTRIPENVYFKIGDDSNGFSLEFKEGEVGKAKIDGVELVDKIREIANNDVDIDEFKREIDSQFTNSDGKLTALQERYENTVRDVNSYKTETTANIGTIERALQEGNFTITGNTVFDGEASFISRGTDERISIHNGSIDFYRTIDGREQRLTRIKNIRYGTVSTDSSGSGIVNFEGFKQPMIVLPTVKSVDFGKNMASIFCYTEHIEKCKYRFYVGGTNEHYSEAKGIKVMGKDWSADNCYMTSLQGITGHVDGFYHGTSSFSSFESKFDKSYGATVYKNEQRDEWRIPKFNNKFQIIKTPKFRITLSINGNQIFTKNYTLKFNISWTGSRYTSNKFYSLDKIDFSEIFSITKKYSNRTNVKINMKIDILEEYYEVDIAQMFSQKGSGYNYDNRVYDYGMIVIKGKIWKLTPDKFKNLSITASAETSTISSAVGRGEVQYIAMEVD